MKYSRFITQTFIKRAIFSSLLFCGVYLHAQDGFQNFYPLEIGNSWTYKFQNMRITETITDTLRFEHDLYYGISYFDEIPELWIRAEEDKIIVLEYPDSSVFTLYDFSRSGEGWELPEGYECSFGKRVNLIGKTDTVNSILKVFEGCYHFTHEPNCADAGIYDTWFYPGVGKVAFNEISIAGPREYRLEEYSILTSTKITSRNITNDSSFFIRSYPNPTNSSARIRFNVISGGRVKLSVFDSIGRLMTSFLEEDLSPGVYEKLLSTDNFASGIYFINIEIAGSVKTSKLMVMK